MAGPAEAVTGAGARLARTAAENRPRGALRRAQVARVGAETVKHQKELADASRAVTMRLHAVAGVIEVPGPCQRLVIGRPAQRRHGAGCRRRLVEQQFRRAGSDLEMPFIADYLGQMGKCESETCRAVQQTEIRDSGTVWRGRNLPATTAASVRRGEPREGEPVR